MLLAFSCLCYGPVFSYTCVQIFTMRQEGKIELFFLCSFCFCSSSSSPPLLSLLFYSFHHHHRSPSLLLQTHVTSSLLTLPLPLSSTCLPSSPSCFLLVYSSTMLCFCVLSFIFSPGDCPALSKPFLLHPPSSSSSSSSSSPSSSLSLSVLITSAQTSGCGSEQLPAREQRDTASGEQEI